MYEGKPQWFQIPGALSYVSYAEGKLSGVDPNGGVWYAENYKIPDWKQVTGSLKQIYLAPGTWKSATSFNYLNMRGGVSDRIPGNHFSHFPWIGDNKNYIRGDTIVNGHISMDGHLSITKADLKISDGQICVKDACMNHAQWVKLTQFVQSLEL